MSNARKQRLQEGTSAHQITWSALSRLRRECLEPHALGILRDKACVLRHNTPGGSPSLLGLRCEHLSTP